MDLKVIHTYNTDPHRNLALEEYLFNNIIEGQCIFYLWQNRHTVVIGKNQNAYKECKVSELKQDGGFLARRPSGGGAVYHDLGNLNFTFITTVQDYNIDRQLSVIVEAVRTLGIHAEKSGRNDIAITGRKFSGNAFLQKGQSRYHHGTILVDVDLSKMGRYLNPSTQKLKAKGVDSVKSRVVNLSELHPAITISHMRKELTWAFEAVYGGKAEELTESSLNEKAIVALYEKYRSDRWIFGGHLEADYEMSEKYDWGEITIQLALKGNIIESAKVYTDAMEVEFADKLAYGLAGCRFDRNEIAAKIDGISIPSQVSADLKQMVLKEEF